MIFSDNAPSLPIWHKDVSQNYRMDENKLVEELLKEAEMGPDTVDRIQTQARTLVEVVRKGRRNQGGIDAFMQQYDLSTQEGLVLMCLAEALLRIPDSETADALIEDKLSGTQWEEYLGKSDSLFVNASTFGLMITGKILTDDDNPKNAVRKIWNNLIKRSGEPVIRQAMRQAMRIMGFQFVLGRTIEEALKRGSESDLYRYSFDMLGEAARTAEDAQRYFQAYETAITALAKSQTGKGPIEENGISVKLSALHPRYELAKRKRVLDELSPMVLKLAQQAKAANIGFTIDAEEAARLELSLEVIEKVFLDPSLDGWDGFGVVVQAYQKRARQVIDMLGTLTKQAGRKMMIRLVKGAYWDSEVKLSQELGLPDYPVFTRKAASDVSYVACAKKLLSMTDCFYSQFATHNAFTVSAIMEIAGSTEFEFQRLHGMGEPLYEQLAGERSVRVYAPVGSHEDLLSYLVRRLLENGANSSFVNRLVDDNTPIDDIIADPTAYLKSVQPKRHPHIAIPDDIYGADRKNAKGIDLTDTIVLQKLQGEMNKFDLPAEVKDASAEEVKEALNAAQKAQSDWHKTPAHKRAEIFQKTADLLEENTAELMSTCVKEAGKTLPDSIAEIREAVDFLRYYANQSIEHFQKGELKARGTFVCISPWNFPLAIFVGQVSAALAAGNCVIAKPAEQTPRIAKRAVELFFEAGLPKDVLHLLSGPGETVGASLIADERIDGVCFTGSNETASLINRNLAKRSDKIVPLIAETGGQNAMIVDSSALLEASVFDVVTSAFGAAGQRCSALRVLYVQDDIADKFIELLKGAMDELSVSDPALLSTDIGPVIDKEAHDNLYSHIERMKKDALRTIASVPVPSEGNFVSPHAFEIANIDAIGREVFGPVLHLVRFKADKLDDVIDEINSTGFGLTCGVQSRIETKTHYIQSRIHAGNCYINRNIIGAVVGVQPFGGEGLSGTGPKAGGPNYLLRFATQDNENTPLDLKGESTLGLSSAQLSQTTKPETVEISPMDADIALKSANNAFEGWSRTPASIRAEILRKTADQLETNKLDLVALSHNDIKGVAETVASLRYYANLADIHFGKAHVLPGPTGEHNELQYHGRGTLVCLSTETNSINAFAAQIAAALSAGNTIVAQGADDLSPALSLIVDTLYKSGLPRDVLSLINQDVLNDPRIHGVCFVGSPETTTKINATLAARDGAILPLITEIGSPHYIHRLVHERTMTVNITAAGGNASLLTLDENQ